MHVGPITVLLMSAGAQVYVYDHYKEKIFQRLDILPERIKRLVIISGAILLFIVFPLVDPDGIINGILTAIGFGIPIYTVLILAFIWIYKGFRK